MGRYTPAARAWLGAVALTALAVTIAGARLTSSPSASDWLALGLLGLCAGSACISPSRAAYDGATPGTANVFLLAGAIILPPSVLTLLPIMAKTPESWSNRRRPGTPLRWLFDVAQATLAVQAAGAVVTWAGARDGEGISAMGALVAAAALFTVVQAMLAGVTIALDSRVSFTRTGVLVPAALPGQALLDVLAFAVVGLWMSRPALLILVPPVLVMRYRLSRTVQAAAPAQVDTETGLHSFRHFEQVLKDEITRSMRAGRPLALLLADLDHFKRVNDEHGQAAGDRVLRAVAGIFFGVLRKGDVPARFSGEELVALLPGADAGQAMYLAERVRAAVERAPLTLEHGAAVRCTVSVGVSVYPDDADDLEGLLRRAERALRRAKQTRNAVARVPPVSPVPVPAAIEPLPAAPRAAKRPELARSSLAAPILWATIALGLLCAAGSAAAVAWQGRWATVLPLLGLAIAAEFLEVRIYEANRHQMSFSFAIAVTMAAVVLAGSGAPLIGAVAAGVHLLFVRQRRPDKVLFNLANPALAATLAAVVYHLLRPDETGFTAVHVAAAFVSVLAFHLTNFGIVSLMVSLHSGQRLVQVVRGSLWSAPTKVFVGLTGAFLAGAHLRLGLLGEAMFIVPVLIMRFTLIYYARNTERTITTLRAAKAEVEEAHREKEETLRGLIDTVASIIDAREPWVLGHSQRVAKYAAAIGREMGLAASELVVVHTGGLLHDLGKVGIPEAVLNKPDRLTEVEYALMKSHAALGERILSDVRPLAEVTRIVGEHHERYDGTGYPRGKRAGEISLGARIVALADALDAILSDRPYSKGRDLQWAMAETERCAGSHFDPDVVAAFLRLAASAEPEFFSSPTLGENIEGCCRDWSARLRSEDGRAAIIPVEGGDALQPQVSPLHRNGSTDGRPSTSRVA